VAGDQAQHPQAYWIAERLEHRCQLSRLRRGLAIAHDSGNRAAVTHLSHNLCLVEAEHGETLAFFDYCTVAIGNYHDSGNTYMIRSPFGLLAAVFYRLGLYGPAATFAGFAATFPVLSPWHRTAPK
jgi:hypothetical protein